jgi:excisionase family DNA binding protein
MDEDEHLTTEEFAKKLKVSTETARRLIRTGKLQAIRIGRNYRIPAAEYERFTTPAAPRQAPRTIRDRIRQNLRSA